MQGQTDEKNPKQKSTVKRVTVEMETWEGVNGGQLKIFANVI